MAGQFWSPAAEGGYMYSDMLSDVLRTKLQPVCRFRQFADATDSDIPLHKGDTARWNIYGDLDAPAGDLEERTPIPETDFTISQASMTIGEGGIAVPYSFKLEAFAQHDVVSVVENALSQNARKYFDAKVYTQFDATALRATPTGGTSLTAMTLDTDTTASVSNNIELHKEHINILQDTMRERNIPPYEGDDYYFLSRPRTFRPLKDDLEAIHIYTDEGMNQVRYGEKGRYDGTRFVEQTYVPEGGAEDSTTFNAFTATGDAWNNAKSSWGFIFGADTVKEILVIPEQIRAKIPDDFGRSKAMAWFFCGGYGIVHTDAVNTRIVKWDSAT